MQLSSYRSLLDRSDRALVSSFTQLRFLTPTVLLEALADFRFGAHCGLKSGAARGPKSANSGSIR
jgi:hypothetical protein